MVIKRGELKQVEESLKKLLNKELPLAAAYLLSKTVKTIEEELAGIEDTRKKLVSKYGVKVEGDGRIVVPPDKMPEFLKEFDLLLDTDLELNYSPIPLKTFGTKLELSAVDLVNLHRFIKEDE